MGFEPTTSTLARLHSTAELFPQRPVGLVSFIFAVKREPKSQCGPHPGDERPRRYSYRRPSTGNIRAAHHEGAIVERVQISMAIPIVSKNTLGLITTGR